jgi:hypothetical protein
MRHDDVVREDRFRRQLRDELVEHMRERELEEQDIADLVGLLPSGAEALMARRDWSLAMCLRVADSLDVEVHPSVAPRNRA